RKEGGKEGGRRGVLLWAGGCLKFLGLSVCLLECCCTWPTKGLRTLFIYLYLSRRKSVRGLYFLLSFFFCWVLWTSFFGSWFWSFGRVSLVAGPVNLPRVHALYTSLLRLEVSS